MGKPRMIILIRHAQSEGNLNRDVHQIVPDHRVKLTPEGQRQAEDAGRKLRSLLRPDDTVRIFTSPYRRTRETTEGILRTLTASDDADGGPSPFSRSAIKVYEEPRLREQDFGNFQPCSAEMERMWQERADYGHFFYRIPNGESAADAYDRCSGFNESLWRAFGDDDFPSVCVLVTHGLMTRVFLMKWYHWSVEYFEDLRNVNHCEFVIMKREESGKFALQNTLRTWSEMRRRGTLAGKEKEKEKPRSQQPQVQSPSRPDRIWGGCVNGCNHDHSQFPDRSLFGKDRKGTADDNLDALSPSSSSTNLVQGGASHKSQGRSISHHTGNSSALPVRSRPSQLALRLSTSSSHLRGRDAGGSQSGLPTPTDEREFGVDLTPKATTDGNESSNDKDETSRDDAVDASNDDDGPDAQAEGRHRPRRTTTVEDLEKWKVQSGMGRGTRADALGDPESESDDDEDDDNDDGENAGLADVLRREEEHDRSLRGSVY